MKRITDWNDLLATAGEFLGSARPLDAMTRAGITLTGEVGAAIQKSRARPANSPEAFERLVRTYGPPPPIRMHVGRTRRPPVIRLLRPGNHQLTASIDLAVLNQTLAALWSVKTIPQQLDDDDTGKLLSVSDLRNVCSGVPPDATALEGLRLPAPPVLSSGGAATNIHVQLSLGIAAKGSGAAGLVCVLQIEVPLSFTFTGAPETRLLPALMLDSLEVTGIAIDASSTIVPLPGQTAALEGVLQSALRTIALDQASISTTFADATINRADAVTVARPPASFLVVGANLTGTSTTQGDLTQETLPAAPANLRIAADESFATGVLTAAIASGDLASAINGLQGQTVVVNSGSVSFAGGSATITLDLTAPGACGISDLDMTATLSGKVGIEDNAVTILSPVLDLDLDDFDAVVCALAGAVAGPVGLAITTTLTIQLAAENPVKPDLILPAFPPVLLPGTELDLRVDFRDATTDAGTLFADAVCSLAADPTACFIYLRILSGPNARLAGPLAGATVELFELDKPPPAGDDVVVQPHPRPGYQLTYAPSPDQALGSAVTDGNGFVQFAVWPNDIAGRLTETKTTEDPRTGKAVTTTTNVTMVAEAKPDFGVNITGPDGSVLATRRLVALNVADRHVGSDTQPVAVVVNPIRVIGNA